MERNQPSYGVRQTTLPEVRVPVMLHRWRSVTFVHWAYDQAAVARLLPPGLEVETYDDAAWIGLIAFHMNDVRAPRVPAVPWLSNFPETNVRTYVRSADGRTGIWFFSLDAARLAAVAAGRATYGLRYCWSTMRVAVDGNRIAYRSRRLLPGPVGASCRLTAEVGGTTIEQGEFDTWLTERHTLFTRIAGRLASADAEHPPWILQPAAVLDLDESLLAAAGLGLPDGEPKLHYSTGTEVRIGRWSIVRRDTGRR